MPEQGVDILYYAASLGHDQVVTYLLGFMDSNAHYDKNEKSALQVATKNGHFQVVAALL